MKEKAYKIYFNWPASVLYLFLCLGFVVFLIYSLFDKPDSIFWMIFYWSLFLPGAIYTFLVFMLFSNVIITISKVGLSTKNGFGKKRVYLWDEIEKVISNQKIFDGVSGYSKGISFIPLQGNKKNKTIHVFDCKKLRLAITEFVPKNKIK